MNKKFLLLIALLIIFTPVVFAQDHGDDHGDDHGGGDDHGDTEGHDDEPPPAFEEPSVEDDCDSSSCCGDGSCNGDEDCKVCPKDCGFCEEYGDEGDDPGGDHDDGGGDHGDGGGDHGDDHGEEVINVDPITFADELIKAAEERVIEAIAQDAVNIETLEVFDRLLAQAQARYAEGDYEQAGDLARQAKDVIDNILCPDCVDETDLLHSDEGHGGDSDVDDGGHTDDETLTKDDETKDHEVPEGCTIVTSKGFSKIECEEKETVCPTKDEQSGVKDKCEREGGQVEVYRDHQGCAYYHCSFEEVKEKDVFLEKKECLSDAELRRTAEKCKSIGQDVHVYFEKGCRTVVCADLSQRDDDKRPDADVEDCKRSGGVAVKDFDENGNKVIKCEQQDYCRKSIPKEAVLKCDERGGELITHYNDEGCLKFFDCVTRGNEDESYVAPVTDVPSTTKLMQVALALERLKIELDKLARDTDGIAEYYKSIGSDSDYGRYKRVSGMFKGVISKVDEIKNHIRDNLDSISTTDMEQIKSDIRYIKDVVLKDIVYVMLSTGDDFEVDAGDSDDCGTDEQCFQRAFRICKTVSYEPEDSGMTVNVVGIEDDKCVIEVTKDSDSMTCTLSDYAFGLGTKDEILPYCEGGLVKLMEAEGKNDALPAGTLDSLCEEFDSEQEEYNCVSIGGGYVEYYDPNGCLAHGCTVSDNNDLNAILPSGVIQSAGSSSNDSDENVNI